MQPVVEASLWVLRLVLTLVERLLPQSHKLRVLALPDLTHLASAGTVRATLPSNLWKTLGRWVHRDVCYGVYGQSLMRRSCVLHTPPFPPNHRPLKCVLCGMVRGSAVTQAAHSRNTSFRRVCRYCGMSRPRTLL